MAMVVVLMGVSGTGKTTLGLRLAGDLGWRFIDADDFHSPESTRKLAAGESLSDGEVHAWMVALRDQVVGTLARGEDAVLAYSALKSGTRHELAVDPKAVRFVYLKGPASLVRRRLRSRSGHFLRETMLASQFASLEEPDNAITIDIDERPGRIVEQIREALAL
jgi:gluconokinase